MAVLCLFARFLRSAYLLRNLAASLLTALLLTALLLTSSLLTASLLTATELRVADRREPVYIAASVIVRLLCLMRECVMVRF